MKRRVVVTGMGTINSLGNSVKESYKALMNHQSGISNYTPIWESDKALRVQSPTLFDPWPAGQVSEAFISPLAVDCIHIHEYFIDNLY